MNEISESKDRNIFPLVGSTALISIYALLNLWVIYLTGPYAWDDGAITLAFAKTLSENGIFALTKESEIVEGTSSLLLSFLMAAFHSTFNFTFNGFIEASQLFSFMALSVTLILIYQYIRRSIPAVSDRIIVIIMFGGMPMFIAENLNGMEMTLFALLITATVITYEAKSLWLITLVPLLLLVRFEAIFYLTFSFTLLCLINKNERGRAALWGGYAIFVFLILSYFRWIYFEDVLPNTIWAKMNPPYSDDTNLFNKSLSKIGGLKEFLTALDSLRKH